MARMDCNYAYKAAAKAHPEWFEREETDRCDRTASRRGCSRRACSARTSASRCRQSSARSTGATGRTALHEWLAGCRCADRLLLHACRDIYRTKVGGVPPVDTDATSLLYRNLRALQWTASSRCGNSGMRWRRKAVPTRSTSTISAAASTRSRICGASARRPDGSTRITRAARATRQSGTVAAGARRPPS